MITLTAEATGATRVTGAGKAKPAKKARVAPKHAHVAAKTASQAAKPKASKKPPKAAKTAGAARGGSKTANVLDLLKRPDGATLKELMKATGWQAHSVRGFLSGTVGKKMGLTVTSAKGDAGERAYSVKP